MFIADVRKTADIPAGEFSVVCLVDKQYEPLLGLATLLGKRLAAGDCEFYKGAWTLQLFGDEMKINGEVTILLGTGVE